METHRHGVDDSGKILTFSTHERRKLI